MIRSRLTLLKKILPVLLCCTFLHSKAANNYTWTGSASSNWSTPGNWSPPVTPLTTDNVTIVTGTNPAQLIAATSIAGLTVLSGTLDLNSFQLTCSATAKFLGGSVSSGTVSALNFTAENTTFNSSTLIKGGAGTSTSKGGNIFNGTTYIINSSNVIMRLANTNPDIFNGDVYFRNTGSQSIQPAYNAQGTIFNGNIYVSNTNAGGNSGIRFGGGIGTSTLSPTKTISIDVGAGGYTGGRLDLFGFTQQGSATPQTFTLTGTTTALYIGSSNPGINPTSFFEGDVNFAAPNVFLNGAEYERTATITKLATATASSEGTGGNHFNSATFINNSNSQFGLASNASLTPNLPDTFDTDVTYIINPGSIYQSNGQDSTLFRGNIIINRSGSGSMTIGGLNSNPFPPTYGYSELAPGKTITATGFNSGSLNINYMTIFSGPTFIPPVLSGTAVLNLVGCNFGGDVASNISWNANPATTLAGCTFYGISSFTNSGSGTLVELGGDFFNKPATFKNPGTGGITISSTAVFNDSALFKNIGGINNTTISAGGTYNGYSLFSNLNTGASSRINIGGNGNCYFNGNIDLENKGEGMIYFGAPAVANNTFLNSGTLTVGPNGFNTGRLSFHSVEQYSLSVVDLHLGGSTIADVAGGLTGKCTFYGSFTLEADQITAMRVDTFGISTNLTLHNIPGPTYQQDWFNPIFGSTTFNGPVTITDSAGPGTVLNFAHTQPWFLSDVTFKGTGPIVLGGGGVNSTFFCGENVTVNTDLKIIGYARFRGTMPQHIYGDTSRFDCATLLILESISGGVTMHKDVYARIVQVDNFLDLNNNTLFVSGNTLLYIIGGGINNYIKSEDITGHNAGKVVLYSLTSISISYIPFGTNISGTNYYIPFIFKITNGTADTVTISTYHTNASSNPNNRPLPASPDSIPVFTHDGIENSPYAIDRFWQIDVVGTPTADITFTYPDPELTGVGTNTIVEANLQAQRWTGSDWSLPMGTVGVSSNTVTVTNVTNFSPWVLVDNTHPLNCPQILSTTDDVICSGDSIVLSATQGSINNYFWRAANGLSATNSSTGVKASPAATSTYTVTDSGCGIPATVTVTIKALPSITVSPDLSVCYGGITPITVTGNSFAYSWSPASYLDTSVGSNVNFENAPAGVYNYLISGSTLGSPNCTNSKMLSITVYPTPSLSASNAFACIGYPATLTASGDAGNYTWSPATGLNLTTGSTVSAFISSAGTYTYNVSIVDMHACFNSAGVTLTVGTALPAYAAADTVLCIGDSVLLTGSGGTNYSWEPSSGLSSTAGSPVYFDLSVPGTYAYTLTASTATCKGYDEVIVTVVGYPTVYAGEDISILTGSSITLNAQSNGQSNVWNPPIDMSCANCLTPVVNPPYSVSYIITSGNGKCMVNDTVNVYVNSYPCDIFVPDAFSPNGDGANDTLFVYSYCINPTPYAFRIYDRWGRLQFESLSYDPKIGWNGKYLNHILAPDVFVYYLSGTTIYGAPVSKKGNITLNK